MSVVVSEFMDAVGIDVLCRAGFSVVADEALWRDRAALVRHVADAKALIVRNQTQVNRELLGRSPHLQVVGRLGVGLDNIDVEACRASGVPVVLARGANAVAVAEYVIASLFSLVRPLLFASDAVRRGEWPRQRFTGFELAGKTLGIVGFGDIGQKVARRARALDMAVCAYDPVIGPGAETFVRQGVAYRELDDLLAHADFVTLHVPLTQETRRMMGQVRLRRMKRGAFLINTARGEIVDEGALIMALQDGHLGGAVLDVRAVEPPEAGDALAALPHVISTPHVAGLTSESQSEIARRVAEDVVRVLSGSRPVMTA